jgi:hypothetical protein
MRESQAQKKLVARELVISSTGSPPGSFVGENGYK